jgi:hypothetical protein
MRRFITQLVLFLLPLVALFGPAFYVLWRSGEFYSLPYIGMLARSAHPVLIGDAYSNYETQYQLTETQVRQPDVLALGNSAVSSFRAGFFINPEKFYNATHAILALSDFSHFIDRLQQPPKVMIIAMLPTYFNPDYSTQDVVSRPDPYASPVAFYGPAIESFIRNQGWWHVYADWYHGKFTLPQVFNDPRVGRSLIGLRTVSENYGFTNDGSDYYGDIVESSAVEQRVAQQISDRAAAVSTSTGYGGNVLYGSGISVESERILGSFLQECKDKGIFVIGYIPPFAHAGNTEMRKHPDAPYAYEYTHLSPALTRVYREYGFPVYDFSDPAYFGGSDAEFVDAGFHASEVADLRILLRMTQDNPALDAYTDTAYLKHLLQNASSSVAVFTPPRF